MKSNKFLLAPIFMVFANTAFSATVKSATAPLSGTYTFTNTESCTADINSGLPSIYASSYTKFKAGQRTFTPDTSSYIGATPIQGLNAWLNLKGLPSLNSLINITQDPTTTAGVKLAETPVEWGAEKVQKTHGPLTEPYTTLPNLTTEAVSQYFVVTSFNYAVPANNNNIKTGYAVYMITAGEPSWNRVTVYLNINSTSKLVTSASHINTNTNIISYTNGSVSSNYTFDCVNLGQLSQ